jgi:hypothetical protein
MVSALVRAFLAAKLDNPRESKALYAIAEGRGGARLAARAQARLLNAIATMLATAPNARFVDSASTATIVLGAMVGAIQPVLEGWAVPGLEMRLENELSLLLTTYLEKRLRS